MAEASRKEKIIAKDALEMLFGPLDGSDASDAKEEIRACNHEQCEWKGTDSQRVFHKCPFDLLKCRNEGCDKEITRRFLTAHEELCPHRALICRFCGRPGHLISNYRTHIEKECRNFHNYRKGKEGKWSVRPISKGALESAFAASSKFEFQHAADVTLQVCEQHAMEMEEKMRIATLRSEEVVSNYKEKDHPTNPLTWDDQKIVRYVKRVRCKKAKKRNKQASILQAYLIREAHKKLKENTMHLKEQLQKVTQAAKEKEKLVKIHHRKRHARAIKEFELHV